MVRTTIQYLDGSDSLGEDAVAFIESKLGVSIESCRVVSTDDDDYESQQAALKLKDLESKEIGTLKSPQESFIAYEAPSGQKYVQHLEWGWEGSTFYI